MIDSADFVKSPADGWKRLREIEIINNTCEEGKANYEGCSGEC
jgi:hypothetical protein